MNIFKQMLFNFPLICAGSGWLLAQIIKVFTGIFKMQEFSLVALLWGSGGMPSSHTAAVCALCMGCGLSEGFGSVAFAISFILCAIVMRDATGVRRETGEQAKILNRIMDDLFKPVEEGKEKPDIYHELKELVGHTPLQVAVGAVIGIAIPFFMRLIPAFGVSLPW
jgi:acid phosphatase family membrane protein YuiD